MASYISPKAIVCDLGDVLFNWSPSTTTAVPPKLLRSFLTSDAWFEYECGRIDQAKCYRQMAEQFAVSTEDIAEALTQARNSLSVNNTMVSFLQDIKTNQALKIFAMSNISKEDFPFLSNMMTDWPTLFDRKFTSGYAGMRKPDPVFFQYVLKEIDLQAEEVIFIDDNKANVLAAKALGMKGILFDSDYAVIRILKNLLSTPVEKAYQYLYRNGKKFDSITSAGVNIGDNFARLLILEATGKRDLVDIEWKPDLIKTWNFFDGEPHLAQRGSLPDDLDTTCLALINLRPSPAVASSLLDGMKEWLNDDGFFSTYYDRTRPRFDIAISANILACFYFHDRGHEIKKTLDKVYDSLENRTYINGTYYYQCPDCCLFFFGRLLQHSRDERLRTLLKARVEERIGQEEDALNLAMRIITAASVGVACETDREALMKLQKEDGGWEACWMYRYGTSGIKIGNSGVTTAMAIKAILSRS